MFFISKIADFFNGFFGFMGKIFDWIKYQQAIQHGKELKEAEIIKQNQEIVKKQNEILTTDRTKEEVIEKMEKGNF